MSVGNGTKFKVYVISSQVQQETLGIQSPMVMYLDFCWSNKVTDRQTELIAPSSGVARSQMTPGHCTRFLFLFFFLFVCLFSCCFFFLVSGVGG